MRYRAEQRYTRQGLRISRHLHHCNSGDGRTTHSTPRTKQQHLLPCGLIITTYAFRCTATPNNRALGEERKDTSESIHLQPVATGLFKKGTNEFMGWGPNRKHPLMCAKWPSLELVAQREGFSGIFVLLSGLCLHSLVARVRWWSVPQPAPLGPLVQHMRLSCSKASHCNQCERADTLCIAPHTPTL